MIPSEHTRLINKFIGLCNNTRSWPNPLGELGYEVQLIEQEISIKNAQKINPDVITVSRKLLHAIAADCKGGKNIDKDQLSRYQDLQTKDLEYWVTVHDRSQLNHVVSYVDTDDQYDNHKDHIGTFPLITFHKDKIVANGDFGKKEVNDKFSNSISLSGALEPMSFYPFSPNDEDFIIVPYVLRALISILTKKGREVGSLIRSEPTYDAILKEIHPFVDSMSVRHRTRLREIIKESINIVLGKYPDFREQVVRLETGDFNVSTLRSLQTKCEQISDQYKTQKRITDEYRS